MSKQLRRSMLYLPGNNPGMVQNAMIYGADSILLDLEDSITVSEKDAVRILVRNALKEIDYGKLEVTVRINPLDTDFGKRDLKTIIPAKPDAIRLPKSESAQEVKEVDEMIGELEVKAGLEEGTVKLMPMIETARGVCRAYEIASACSRVVALTIGGEDLTADLGVSRTPGGEEIFTARSEIVLAASAAGVDALDTVYSRVNDIEGLIEDTKLIKKLGFDGKAVIHPKQIEPVHQVFTPSEEEVKEAKKIVKAAKEAEKQGKGVITVNGKMVDEPIVNRARETLERTEK